MAGVQAAAAAARRAAAPARRPRRAAARASAGEGAPPPRNPNCNKDTQRPVALGTGLPPETEQRCLELTEMAPVVLFMKGNREQPRCGFSATSVQVLNACRANFETVDVLDDPSMRDAMKIFSSWPTFPQLYVEGEFYGGCDILMEMYQDGELQELIERVNMS